MNLPKLSFTAAGDMLIQRVTPLPYEGFEELSAFIRRGDARFFNLETTLHRGGLFGNQFNGGSFLRADPEVLDVARAYGFNMLSFANNHTFDFSYGGLLATLEAVRAARFVNAGVGENLDAAAAPAYLDTPNGRVALIGTVSSMSNEAAMAGRQSRRVAGRPGVNGLRVKSWVEVTPEQYAVIRQVSDESGVNVQNAISRAEGYDQTKPQEGVAEFGKFLSFVLGDRTQFHTAPNEKDVARIGRAIYEAQAQADYILVSIHAHQLAGRSKETPAEFLETFARRCIDMGAHAVIGHGPHLLRPLEIYKGCPIFYSLGDFVLHNESMTYAPEDMYEKMGLTSDDPLREIFRVRSHNYTSGLLCDRRMMESVVPYFEMENGALTKLELMPVALGVEEPRYRNGNPRFRPERGILERLAQMSEPYGTKITIRPDGIGEVEL